MTDNSETEYQTENEQTTGNESETGSASTTEVSNTPELEENVIIANNILKDRVEQSDLINLPDWQVAEILNRPDSTLDPITEWRKTSIGYGAILEVLGPNAGAAFLDALETLAETLPQIKWALRIIDRGVLDLSSATARAQVQAAISPPLNLLTQAQVDALFSLSRRERYPSWAEYHQIEVTARTVGLARGAI